MCSTAENPSVGRKASCHCSPAPPRKPSEKCQIEFKSTPRQIAKIVFKIMPLNTGAPDLTGQQWAWISCTLVDPWGFHQSTSQTRQACPPILDTQGFRYFYSLRNLQLITR